MYIEKILAEIKKKNPMHEKRVYSFLDTLSKEEIKTSERYLAQYFDFMKWKNIPLEAVTEAYLSMVESIVLEQIYFLKHGKYRYDSLEETKKHVYHNEAYMPQYMMGVAMSQFLWENHYEMFSFFKKHIHQIGMQKKYLEIGVGHGLFFNEALESSSFEYYQGVDISPTSLSMTKEMAERFHPALEKRIQLVLSDILDYETEEGFDFITMGEVLEHVERPDLLLRKVKALLSPNGQAYISTCANAPVVDHIYLYHDVGEIEAMIDDCGLDIVEACEISIDHIPKAKWQEEKANISYAAIVKAK